MPNSQMAAGTGTVPIAGDLVIEDIVAVNSESVRLVVRLYDCRPNSATSKADKSIVEGHAVLDNAVPVISQRSNLMEDIPSETGTVSPVTTGLTARICSLSRVPGTGSWVVRVE